MIFKNILVWILFTLICVLGVPKIMHFICQRKIVFVFHWNIQDLTKQKSKYFITSVTLWCVKIEIVQRYQQNCSSKFDVNILHIFLLFGSLVNARKSFNWGIVNSIYWCPHENLMCVGGGDMTYVHVGRSKNFHFGCHFLTLTLTPVGRCFLS